jgi:hypothetical protein
VYIIFTSPYLFNAIFVAMADDTPAENHDTIMLLLLTPVGVY